MQNVQINYIDENANLMPERIFLLIMRKIFNAKFRNKYGAQEFKKMIQNFQENFANILLKNTARKKIQENVPKVFTNISQNFFFLT